MTVLDDSFSGPLHEEPAEAHHLPGVDGGRRVRASLQQLHSGGRQQRGRKNEARWVPVFSFGDQPASALKTGL